MLRYPYYENDEGTYFSQAYSVAYEGKLASYTYWYDHAPAGWILTALWIKFTGGPFVFGYSLFSARIFMLLVHVLSSATMFAIVKKITGKNWAAFVAVCLFSLSPLGVFFQRRMLLDNIMTLWLLLAFALILYGRSRLFALVIAGVAFSLAVLTKETAIVALPGLLYLAFHSTHRRQRLMGLTTFAMPFVLGISYYILYAAIKNELFPGPGHVSLIQSLLYQVGRNSGVPFWREGSDFAIAFNEWIRRDGIFTVSSIVSGAYMYLAGIKKQFEKCALGLISLFFWLFLIRGGLVINFYLIPIVALGSISIAILASDLINKKLLPATVFISLVLTLWIQKLDVRVWVDDEASPQLNAIEWVKKNLSPTTLLAVDDSIRLDLRLSRFRGDPAFKYAHWFWKLSADPEIRDGVAKGDWQNIDYLVLSHEFVRKAKNQDEEFLTPTLDHSQEIISWGPSSRGTFVDIGKRISTNGDWMAVYKVNDRTNNLLADSWSSYKKKFITPDGQVIDPQTGKTTSEGQAYAMLRAVVADDIDTFKLIWNWTRFHLQFRKEDKLFSWVWGKRPDGTTGVIDSGFATDADIDIATALVLGSRRWKLPELETEATKIINDIWRQAVIKVGNSDYYLIAGSWAGYGDIATVNPSYLSPAAFKLFSEIDESHNWLELRFDSYQLLNRLAKRTKTGLIPDWIGIDKQTGEIVAPSQKELSRTFGYDAMRVYWRVAQDYYWFGSKESLDFFSSQRFPVGDWKEHGRIEAGFSLNGKPLATYEDGSFYGAFLPFFAIVDPTTFENTFFLLKNSYQDGAWANSDNYYTQNWVWLGIALTEKKIIYYEK